MFGGFEFSSIGLCHFSYFQIISFLNHRTNKHGSNGSYDISRAIGTILHRQVRLAYLMCYSTVVYRFNLSSFGFRLYDICIGRCSLYYCCILNQKLELTYS